MAINIDYKYRVKRNSEQEAQMRYLINDLKVFNSYSQILVISALLGYNSNESAEVNSPASDGVLMQFFEEDDKNIINLLAYAKDKKQSVLSAKDDENKTRMYSIFENYANAGFSKLINKLQINFDDYSKNDRLIILKRYYTLLLTLYAKKYSK